MEENALFYDYALTPSLSCRIVPRAGDEIEIAKRFIDLLIAIWRTTGNSPTPSVILSFGKEIRDIFPGIANNVVKKKGGLASENEKLQREIYARFQYCKISSCLICGNGRFVIPVNFTEFRSLLNPNDLSKKSVFNADELLEYRKYRIAFSPRPGSDREERYPKDENWVIFEPEKIPLCPNCEKVVVKKAVVVGIAEREEIKILNERYQEESRKFCEEHPPFIVVSVPSGNPNEFSRLCCEWIDKNYRMHGGMLIDPAGNLVQAFLRRNNHDQELEPARNHIADFDDWG